MSLYQRYTAPMRRMASFLGESEGRLTTRVIRSGMWISVSHGLNSVLEVVRQAILGRLLGPEAFGILGICLVFTRGLELFTELGIGPALIHRQTDIEKATQTAFTMRLFRGVGLTLVTWPIAVGAALWYQKPELRELLFALSFLFTISALVNPNTILLSKQLDFRRLTILDITVTLGGTITVISAAFAFRSVWALVAGNVVSALVRVGMSYVLLPGRPTLRFDKAIAKELIQYGRYITGFTLLQFVFEFDKLLVSKLLGFRAAGFYELAFRLANLPATHIQRVAATVFFPAYSSLQNDKAKLAIAYLTVMRVVGGLAIPAAIGLSVLAPDVMRVVWGPSWIPAGASLRLLALYGLARSIAGITGNLHNAVGKPQMSFYLTVGKLVVTAIAIYPMTIWWGIEGTAIAVSVPQLLMMIGGLFVAQRQVGIDLRTTLGALSRILIASTVMAAVVGGVRAMLPPIGVGGFVGLIVLGMVTYALLSFREVIDLKQELLGRKKTTPSPKTAPPETEDPPAAVDSEVI
jgi:O-antigen/teichoic acid export membrane protein